jgi:hypothetical protein
MMPTNVGAGRDGAPRPVRGRGAGDAGRLFVHTQIDKMERSFGRGWTSGVGNGGRPRCSPQVMVSGRPEKRCEQRAGSDGGGCSAPGRIVRRAPIPKCGAGLCSAVQAAVSGRWCSHHCSCSASRQDRDGGVAVSCRLYNSTNAKRPPSPVGTLCPGGRKWSFGLRPKGRQGLRELGRVLHPSSRRSGDGRTHGHLLRLRHSAGA